LFSGSDELNRRAKLAVTREGAIEHAYSDLKEKISSDSGWRH
jgi:hypothetical protein